MTDFVMNDLDVSVRSLVYDRFMSTGRSPSVADVASALGAPTGDVQGALVKLAGLRQLVLQSNGELLMANPFSAVPTSYVVQAGERTYWGNCIWDAMGIPAILNLDAVISTACPDCGDAMQLTVESGRLTPAEGIVHFAVPARKWWEDIVYS
jgi:hypothetical protein